MAFGKLFKQTNNSSRKNASIIKFDKNKITDNNNKNLEDLRMEFKKQTIQLKNVKDLILTPNLYIKKNEILNYCAQASAILNYRKILDDINDEKGAKNVFSRSGFTQGYYENKLGKDMFGIRTKEDVLSADKAFPVLHELPQVSRNNHFPIQNKHHLRLLCDILPAHLPATSPQCDRCATSRLHTAMLLRLKFSSYNLPHFFLL